MKFKIQTELVPVETLSKNLEKFECSYQDIKKIKIFNFLNFHKEILFRDEDELLYLKIFFNLEKSNVSDYQKINICSIILNSLFCKIIIDDNFFNIKKAKEETEHLKNMLLYFRQILEKKEYTEIIQKNLFAFVLKFLQFISQKEDSKYNLPNSYKQINNVLHTIHDKNLTAIQIFTSHFDIFLSILEFLIEISYESKPIRKFNKSQHRKGKTSTETLYSDSCIVIYVKLI